MQPVTVSLRRRDSLLLAFFVLAAVGLSYRLYTWQVTNAGMLDLRGTNEHVLQVSIDAPRGRIYDSQGKVLVTNVEFDRVYAVPPDELTTLPSGLPMRSSCSSAPR